MDSRDGSDMDRDESVREASPRRGRTTRPAPRRHTYRAGGPPRPPRRGSGKDSAFPQDRPSRRRPGSSRHVQRIRIWQRLWFKIAVGAVAGLVAISLAGGTYLYEHLMGNIQAMNLNGLTHRPPKAAADAAGNTQQNILVLGSQTRDGQHGINLGNSTKLGTDISDTAMLFHLSAERKWAEVVSIPRDLIVSRPRCHGRKDPSQIVPSSQGSMFDLAMNLGGPVCAVATVEQMTGIRIDHFVEITFNAFQDLTNAVGGVSVCVPPPGINDPNYSGLVLGPGLHTVSGAQSLAFVRDRHGIGDGSDLGRIQMQQMFVSSLFQKVTSDGTLSNPVTLIKIANAVTTNLTVDDGLKSVPAMIGLAQSVRGIKAHYIQFITAPEMADPTDHNRVVPAPSFQQVWTNLKRDQPLPGSNAAREFGTSAHSLTSTPPPNPLTSVTVKVYNGTTTPRRAAHAAANLKSMGAHTSVGLTGYSHRTTTEILYPAQDVTQAQILQQNIPGAQLKPSTTVTELTLVLGTDAPPNLTAAPTTDSASGSGQGGPSPAATSTAPIDTENRSGDENICSNLPTPVKYGGHP